MASQYEQQQIYLRLDASYISAKTPDVTKSDFITKDP